jgi:nucleotide-binding universal stress UspA family protein
MRTGPIIVGFDGTRAARQALSEAATLLASRDVLVVVVWEAGRAYELAEISSSALDLPGAPLDLRTPVELDQAEYESAQRLAEQGTQLARDAGLTADGLVVAGEGSVADTLVTLAEERDAPAVVLGAHGHGTVSEILLGSTTRDVLHRAGCPVVIVR